MDSVPIEHVLQAIGILVGITAAVIGVTCGLTLKWISSICSELKSLREDFTKFIGEYYDKHEFTVKRDDCAEKHKEINMKVDALHERVDSMEMDRR